MPTWCCYTATVTTKSAANGLYEVCAAHRQDPRTEERSNAKVLRSVREWRRGMDDRPADHNLGGHPWRDSRLAVTPVDRGNTPPVLQEGEHVHLALLCFG
jgi:hypothetical protein